MKYAVDAHVKHKFSTARIITIGIPRFILDSNIIDSHEASRIARKIIDPFNIFNDVVILATPIKGK